MHSLQIFEILFIIADPVKWILENISTLRNSEVIPQG